MKRIEKSKNVVNPWENGNDITQTPFEFETLMQPTKNIFFAAFIQKFLGLVPRMFFTSSLFLPLKFF